MAGQTSKPCIWGIKIIHDASFTLTKWNVDLFGPYWSSPSRKRVLRKTPSVTGMPDNRDYFLQMTEIKAILGKSIRDWIWAIVRVRLTSGSASALRATATDCSM